MKLLNIISNYFIVFSLLFLGGSIVIYFTMVSTYDKGVYEHLNYERSLVIKALKEGVDIKNLPYNVGDKIEVNKLPSKPATFKTYISDTMLVEPFEHEMYRCKQIQFKLYHKNNYYNITIFKSLLDKEEFGNTNIVIVIVLLLFLIFSLIIIQHFVSRWALKPFYSTLRILSKYDLTANKPISLKESEIEEFQLLNRTITTLSEKVVRDFINLREFTENMSHEVQTPLAIIRSNMELLIQNENLDVKQREQLNAIYESVNRLTKLNKGLIILTQIENNQIVEVNEVNMIDCVKKKLSLFSDMLEEKSIKVTDVHNNALLVKANPLLIETLISNLIGNAVKYTNQNGKLNVMITNQTLLISNTSNVSELSKDKIFLRFNRGKDSSSLGLGLAICNKICTSYGFKLNYFYENPYHTFRIDFSRENQSSSN